MGETITASVLVPFHEDEIEAFWDEATQEILVVCKRICENLGVDWRTQYHKLKNDPFYASDLSMVLLTTERGAEIHGGGTRDTLTLPLRALPLWIASISIKRVSAETARRLALYKKEVQDVLAKHFLGIPPRPERQAALVNAPPPWLDFYQEKLVQTLAITWRGGVCQRAGSAGALPGLYHLGRMGQGPQ